MFKNNTLNYFNIKALLNIIFPILYSRFYITISFKNFNSQNTSLSWFFRLPTCLLMFFYHLFLFDESSCKSLELVKG